MTAVNQAGELRSARIESLRALAALAVLTGHVYGYGSRGFSGSFLEQVIWGGGFGVFLFFALSGYLLYLPFARQHLGGGDRVRLSGYARNRALRILPLYYVVVVTVLVVKENGAGWDQWWRFLLFAENFSLDTVTDVNGVLWSLVVELHFYALLPLIAVAAAWLGRGTRLGAAIVLSIAAGASLAVHFTKVRGSEDPSAPLWRYSILATFFFFVAGMLVALLRIAWAEGRPSWLRGPLASADVWLLASVPVWLFVFDDFARGPLAAVASMLIVGAAVLPLEPGPLMSALSWRPLALVGVASYSLYLWHVPILDLITDLVGAHQGFASLLALALPAALAAAFVSYAVIEAPFLRLRRRWTRSTPASTPPGPTGYALAMPVSETSDGSQAARRALEDNPVWYHTLELAPGVVTPGHIDLRETAPKVLPDAIVGRALDVGTFDGFWAFELERRGAETVAIDVPVLEAAEWPTINRARLEARARELDVQLGRGFALAAEALGSSVTRIECPVQALAPDAIGGPVDFVFSGAILLHLRDPVGALERIRGVLRPGGEITIVEPFSPRLTLRAPRRAVAEFQPLTTSFNWWLANLAALRSWLLAAGFEDVSRRGFHRPPSERRMRQWQVALAARNPSS